MRTTTRQLVVAAASTVLLVAALSSCASSQPSTSEGANAANGLVPRQVIIMRHGEKHNDYALCDVGQQRSLALAKNYVGQGADNSLFADGAGPDGFMAITLHSLELISPAAQSWNMPVDTFSVVPLNKTKAETTLELNQRTQEAANALLTDPRWGGKTVVMAWEHDHIAKESLEKKFPGEEVTLRQLLNLDKLPDVPTSWPGTNYDYFWIVDYGNPGSDVPTSFKSVKQTFPAPFESVPSNDWNTPETLPPNSGCKAHTK